MKVHANVTARTRFTVPSIPNATITRQSLLGRLDANHCDLTLVAAAAGSGKTALLTQWGKRLDGPVAWLSCDVDDADPSWFWRDVIGAIRHAWTEIPLGDGELTDAREARQLAIEIANELAAQPVPGTIIIDDLHLAAPEPAAMVAFIDALPSWVRLVIGTRHDPLVPLGRMRVQGRLLELRQTDLRFSNTEIEQAMATHGIALDSDELQNLADVTEGWAAGVHLAGLSFAAGATPDKLLRRLVETDHSLIDFLMNEVIELQSPDLLTFLTTTAELGEFDVELCDAVLGRTDSRDVLAAVRSANLFLVALDGDGARYRYHHLFGEFLRAHLRSVDVQRITVIHRSAAEALAERRDLVRSIHHGLRAGDTEGALERLTTHMAVATTLDDQSTGGIVAQAWLDERGMAELESAPQRVLACVVALNAAHMRDEAERWLRRVEANRTALDRDSRYVFEQTTSFHLLYRGDPVGALEAARRAKAVLDEGPVDSIWVPTLPMMFLQAYLWLGDADGATATIDAYEQFPVQTPVVTMVRMPSHASQIAVLRGDYNTAQRLVMQAEAAAQRIGLSPDAFGMAELVASAADIALERNQLTEAEARTEHLMRIVDNGRRPLLEVICHLLFARLASARGDEIVVGVHLERARGVIPEALPPVAHIDAAELRYAVRRGDMATAETILRRLPASVERSLLACRVRLSTGDHAGARAELRSVTPTTPRRQIEHLVVQALANAGHDLEAAHESLHEALAIARTMGYHQSIVEEGPVLWTLLRSLPTDGHVTSCVDELLAATAGVLPIARASDQRHLVEPLSERELTVLRYLSSRLDAAEIAGALYLSVNTVRSHVKAIYRKLDVNVRADAVRRGRQLGLI